MEVRTILHLSCVSSPCWVPCWRPGRRVSAWEGWWACRRASSTGSGSTRFSAFPLSSSPEIASPKHIKMPDQSMHLALSYWQILVLPQIPEALICNCKLIQASLEYTGIQVASVLCKSYLFPGCFSIKWDRCYPHPVLFGESLHFLVEEEVDGQSVTCTIGKDGAENLAVLVVHFLRHVHQHRVVDFLDVDP